MKTALSAPSPFMARLIRILHSVVAANLLVLYTIAMGFLAMVIALFDKTGTYQHWCARAWCRMIALTVGLRVTVTGLEHLPRQTPVVILSNHQSLLDIPVLFITLPFQFRVLAKQELFRIPLLGGFLKRAGHIPVDRGNRRATPKLIRSARNVLDAGIPVVIFPEGTRNLQPTQVKAFKAGGFRLAREARVPLVPITIYGTAAFLPPRSLCLTPCPVHLTIHPPLNAAEISIEEAMAQVASIMNERLAALATYDGLAKLSSSPVTSEKAVPRP
jgi:1-acyl-sn-glycerol-3-phosphate acyltransferase